MKLSVIIPAYNRADLIRDTIDSILNSGQDDLEIVVVDDGSTDQTPDVVQPLGPPGPLSPPGTTRALPRPETMASRRARGRVCRVSGFGRSLAPGHGSAPGSSISTTHQDIPFVFGDAAMGSPETGFVSFVETFGGDAFRNLPSREIEPGVRRLRPRTLLPAACAAERRLPGQPCDAPRSDGTGGPVRRVPLGRGGLAFLPAARAPPRVLLPRRAHGRDLPATLVEHDEGRGADERGLPQGARAIARRSRAAGRRPSDYASKQFQPARFYHAYSAYDQGDYQTAVSSVSGLPAGSDLPWRPFLYWVGCHFPPTVLTRARHLKQRIPGAHAPGYVMSPLWGLANSQQAKTRKANGKHH